MEDIVITEMQKHTEVLRNTLRTKYNLTESDITQITASIEKSLYEMIRMMKEGKSAHEKFFSDIILNSIDAIIGFDNDLKIFLWNKGAENMFGYTKDEVSGQNFTFFMPDYIIEKGEKEFLINEVKEKGFLANYETERKTKSGGILSVNISGFSIFDQQRKPIGSVGIYRDMTTVKKLQKELREKENLALVGEVVSSIAHSFSNPLNIISGNADYLLLDKKEGDVGYEEMKIILEESAKITKSIRHLMNFSRPLKMEKVKGSINNAISEVLSNSRYLAGEKKIIIKKNFDASLPDISFGKTEIQEVITNLLVNAIQAFKDEGEIRVKTWSNGSYVYIEVQDKGPGIPKENLDKIFLPFYSSKSYGKGTGLGLSIAKKIVTEHGGEIRVKSNIGKGTTFTISLPV